LGVEDPIEVLERGIDVATPQALLRHLRLERESKQLLREIVVEVAGDLHPFVLPLLSHAVRQRSEDPLPILELVPCFLERHGPEEHLPREYQRQHERRDRPETWTVARIQLYYDDTDERQAQVVHRKLPQGTKPQLVPDGPKGIRERQSDR